MWVESVSIRGGTPVWACGCAAGMGCFDCVGSSFGRSYFAQHDRGSSGRQNAKVPSARLRAGSSSGVLRFLRMTIKWIAMLRAFRGPGVPAPHLPRLVSKGQGLGGCLGRR